MLEVYSAGIYIQIDEQNNTDGSRSAALMAQSTIVNAQWRDREGQEAKSPGPDELPAEFYHAFSQFTKGNFDPKFREGEITVLYKKGDPRDTWNYTGVRPITRVQ